MNRTVSVSTCRLSTSLATCLCSPRSSGTPGEGGCCLRGAAPKMCSTSWCWISLSSRSYGGVGPVALSGVTRPGSPAGRGTSGSVTGGRQTPFFSLSLSLSRLLSHSTMKTSANPPETSSPNPCFPSPSLSPCACLFSPQVCESRAAGVGVKPASVCWHCGEPGHFEDQCHVMEVGALVQIPDLPHNEHTL